MLDNPSCILTSPTKYTSNIYRHNYAKATKFLPSLFALDENNSSLFEIKIRKIPDPPHIEMDPQNPVRVVEGRSVHLLLHGQFFLLLVQIILHPGTGKKGIIGFSIHQENINEKCILYPDQA